MLPIGPPAMKNGCFYLLYPYFVIKL